MLNWICFRGMDIFAFFLQICFGESATVLFSPTKINIDNKIIFYLAQENRKENCIRTKKRWTKLTKIKLNESNTHTHTKMKLKPKQQINMSEDILLYNTTLIFVQFLLWSFIFLGTGPFNFLYFLLVSLCHWGKMRHCNTWWHFLVNTKTIKILFIMFL